LLYRFGYCDDGDTVMGEDGMEFILEPKQ
jgi:hypothetical protein